MQKGNTEEIARAVVARLAKSGFTAYFAGGCVRDSLLNLPSADYDIATDATPEEVQALFSHTVPIGVEFGSVIVIIDDLPTEVTSFRSDVHHDYNDGRRPHGIERATPKEDALRRSFTINGMFFDPLEKKIIDYVGGREDLYRGVIRAIGEPSRRFKEDRLRMIRGVRFAARFGFTIDSETRQAIADHAHLLFPAVSMERIWQELHKMASHPNLEAAINTLHELHLLPEIFPALKETSQEEIERRTHPFSRYPQATPLVAYLIRLFPGVSEAQRLAMLSRLKPSKAELKLAAFLTQAEELLHRDENGSKAPSRVEWVRSYTHSEMDLAVELYVAGKKPVRAREILDRQRQLKSSLRPHIERLKKKSPLVTSTLLQQRGVQPGKQMGELLRKAEELAIECNLHTPEQVLDLLNDALPPSA